MGKATLVIMAAGIGSRFGGGIKQLEPVGPNGEIIMDYSIYDALKAGFDKVVFVIRKDLEKDFKEIIGKRIEKMADVEYAFQELEDIPHKYKEKALERKKPWGTGQAILCCKDVVHEPFLVINADDYYGQDAYAEAYQYLTSGAMQTTDNKLSICMVGFVLGNTLSDNGGVTRGICHVDEESMLEDIVETKNIVKIAGGAQIVSDTGAIDVELDAAVSMNMWGFTPEFFQVLEEGFEQFFANTIPEDANAEYLLPTFIGDLLKESKVGVKVLHSKDKWFGVTYKEDKESVMDSIKELIAKGLYVGQEKR